jgi:glyoxylase-like metal-dependent hydrolase (beta-lactamase superfamily II)
MRKWFAYRHGELDYYRFSLYHFGTNMQTVYVFRIGDVLVDTAQSKSRNNLLSALEGRDVGSVVLTHHHEDHTGNAALIRREFNAEIYAHPECVDLLSRGPYITPLGRMISGNVEKVAANPVADLEVLDFGCTRLQAIYTPGHCDDHIAFYEPDRGWLFPGDLYVADRIKYFESNEDIDMQISSLERMCALDFDVLLCSHNPKLKNGKARLARKLELFKQFYGDVADMHRKGMSAQDIFKATGRKENKFYKIMTVGHFTAVNMVKSVIRAEQQKEKARGF